MADLKKTTLPGTELVISRIGFGTASLHHLFTSERRQRLLRDVYAVGITHFDTAPLYGFGIAEKEVGRLLASCPDATVATKVGLYPPGGTEQSFPVTFGRKLLGKLRPALSRAQVDFEVRRAQASLTKSLARLQREYVDLLLLHEPEYSLVDIDEWSRWFERERSSGRIRAFGVSGREQSVAPFCESSTSLATVIQTSDSLSRREADFLLLKGRPLQITYGYLSSERGTRPNFDGQAIVRAALERNTTGCVLISTTRPERVLSFAGVF